MSTKTDRAYRAQNRTLPIKVKVRQTDGTHITQIVDANVRRPKVKKDRQPPQEDLE